MIGNICLLLEQVSILFCIHCLYNQKMKFDIKTLSYLVLYMIMMTAINYYDFPKICTMITYPIMFIYCGIKFGFRWRTIIINMILYLIIIGGIQIFSALCYGIAFNFFSLNQLSFQNEELLLVNGGTLLIVMVLLPQLSIFRLSKYLQDKERILVIFLAFCIILIVSILINYKVIDGFNGYQNLILFVSICFLCILTGQLGKYKIKSKETETELKMQQLYTDTFHSLIDDIRLRQHEFDNHISAIYSLHYTCDSYEELVKAQNEYSQAVIKENQYNKILKIGNPLFIGFLYGKFIEIERLGIEITYNINFRESNIAIPVYKLVEILGNLIKNAVEAMTGLEAQALYVSVVETNEVFEIEVRNKSPFIEYNQIETFFRKGFSKKGKDRGLGLYNVKSICNEFFLEIYCENRMIDSVNWFCITLKKAID